jgi:ribosomal protein S18 acetylase RimI-like enzyme
MADEPTTNDDGQVPTGRPHESSFVPRHAVFINAPCPFLPEVSRIYKAADVHALGDDRGPLFYETSLRYAQSQWRVGLPAQAMLQLNRAFVSWLPQEEPVLQRLPLPYKPMAWIMQQRPEGQFIGNPRRHFQHLATRMTGMHSELRTWRAWACWYLAKVLLPEAEHPADMKQVRQEGVIKPTLLQIREQLRRLSPANDETVWLETLAWAGFRIPETGDVRFEVIGLAGLPTVRDLAHTIWPQVYPGIISEEQINYMLRLRYDLAVLSADLQSRGVRYALIHHQQQVVGYVAFEPRPKDSEAFLHKLYILPEAAGRGIGAAALDWVAEQSSALGLKQVRLLVNKNNHPAVRAYLRRGFLFEKDVVTEIGEGFVMDDFSMVKPLV